LKNRDLSSESSRKDRETVKGFSLSIARRLAKMVLKAPNDRKVKRRSADETCLRAFVGSSDKIYSLVEELGTVFRQKAPEHNIRVLHGSKGSHPNSIHVVEMLVKVWDILALNKEWKDKILSDYADEYIEQIKEKKPDWVMRSKQKPTTNTHMESEADIHGKGT
jgi:hypothetical protein